VGGANVSTEMIVDGMLRPPSGPGIGIEPGPDLTESYPYRVPPPVRNAPALYQGSI